MIGSCYLVRAQGIKAIGKISSSPLFASPPHLHQLLLLVVVVVVVVRGWWWWCGGGGGGGGDAGGASAHGPSPQLAYLWHCITFS